MTKSTTAPENEFALLPETAAALGIEPHTTPQASRKWFTASTGGHVSAVQWGHGTPVATIIPDEGSGARSLDPLALRLGHPVVIVDRPGTGRSSGPLTSPARSGRILAEAAWSFAAHTPQIVGLGAGGGLAALAASARAGAITGVVLLGAPHHADQDTLLVVLADRSVTVERGDDIDVTDPFATADALRTHLSLPTH